MSKILIIDDDSDYAEALKIVLKARSHHVMWAPDSAMGLEMIRSNPPDLIILDIMMSTMGEGIHLTYKLKSNPEYAHIPILMVTAITERTGLKFNPGDDAEFLPVDGYMDKSDNPDAICARVARILADNKNRE
ncbi:PleD family two-component system response regulator [Candidatus Poribacteria bacterium]